MYSHGRARLAGAVLASLTFGGLALEVQGAVLYTDNFNIGDTNSLDGSDQTGRHTGILGSNVVLRSGGVQMTITNQMMDFLLAGGNSGRVRFQDASALPGNALWNFASGTQGAQILTDHGFRFGFDWTPADNTSDNWISLSVGINGFDLPLRVNDIGTDFGILFRNAGGTQLFDNGVATTGANFSVPTVATHHAQIDFGFTSFSDGSTVIATPSVDGVPVGTPFTFQWDNDGGVINLELGNLATGTKLDNVSMSTIPVPEPSSGGLMVMAALGIAAARRRR